MSGNRQNMSGNRKIFLEIGKRISGNCKNISGNKNLSGNCKHISGNRKNISGNCKNVSCINTNIFLLNLANATIVMPKRWCKKTPRWSAKSTKGKKSADASWDYCSPQVDRGRGYYFMIITVIILIILVVTMSTWIGLMKLHRLSRIPDLRTARLKASQGRNTLLSIISRTPHTFIIILRGGFSKSLQSASIQNIQNIVMCAITEKI